jgi:hypothetical protein
VSVRGTVQLQASWCILDCILLEFIPVPLIKHTFGSYRIFVMATESLPYYKRKFTAEAMPLLEAICIANRIISRDAKGYRKRACLAVFKDCILSLGNLLNAYEHGEFDDDVSDVDLDHDTKSTANQGNSVKKLTVTNLGSVLSMESVSSTSASMPPSLSHASSIRPVSSVSDLSQTYKRSKRKRGSAGQ